MYSMDKIKSLIGENVTKEDLKYVDCYVYDKVGIFIPSMGQCQYAIKPKHTHPSYMFIIYFDPSTYGNVNIEIPANYYLSTVLSPHIKHQDTGPEFLHYYCILIEKHYFESQYLLYAPSVPEFNSFHFAMCHDILKTLNIFAFESSKEMRNSDITLTAQSTIITHWLIRSVLQENYDLRTISSNYGIARAQHYIEQHLGETITVNTLATLANMSGELSILDDNNLKDEILNHPTRAFLKAWTTNGELDDFYNSLQVLCMKHGKAITWTMDTNFAPKEYIQL